MLSGYVFLCRRNQRYKRYNDKNDKKFVEYSVRHRFLKISSRLVSKSPHCFAVFSIPISYAGNLLTNQFEVEKLLNSRIIAP